jgi:DnaJ-class molecular chaperone
MPGQGPQWAEIQWICSKCGGDGKYVPPHDTQQPSPSEIDCPQCNGEGYVSIGRLHIKAIMDAIEG